MKIAIVSPGYPPDVGGVEVVVAETARALVRAGHSVEVLTQTFDRTGNVLSSDAGVVVRRFRAVGTGTYPVAPGLWRHVWRHGREYDVLHGHGYHTLAALGATLATGTPFVFSPHYHGTGHSPARALLHRVYRPLGRLAFRRARAVVCVSKAEARLVTGHFPATAGKLTVIPNGVDAERIRAASPFEHAMPIVLAVGRLERYKRVDRLVRAFGHVGRKAQLLVIGDGPDRERLTGLARASAAAGRINFLGRIEQDDLHRWLRTARVLCSFSEHEAFGLAPAEAIAAGTEVLLSNIPAHAELLSAGFDRLVGPDEDDVTLGSRLEAMLTGEPRPVAASILDWNSVAEKLCEVYDRLPVKTARSLP